MTTVTIRVGGQQHAAVVVKYSTTGTPAWVAECCCGWSGVVAGQPQLAQEDRLWHLKSYSETHWMMVIS